MSMFEFLMVLVSIIIGLGIAEILTGVARQIRCRAAIRSYWIHSILVLGFFLALLQQWWEVWSLRNVPAWTFPGLVMMLTGPIGLFLIAHLLFPEPTEGSDFRAYYHGPMRPIWWLAALSVVLSTTFRPLVFGTELISSENATSAMFLLGCVALAVSQRPILHAVAVPLFVLLILLDILQWSLTIAPG